MKSALSMNGTVVGQASRLPLGRLAPESIAGETPAEAAGTAAPLTTDPSWQSNRQAHER